MAKKIKQKEINFLTVLTGRSAKKKLSPRSLIMPGVVLVILVVGVGMFSMLTMDTNRVEAQSDVIREYLDSPETNRQLMEAANLESQAQYMSYLAEETVSPINNVSSYPDMTRANYEALWGYAGANIELGSLRYDRTTGVLSFTATSDYVLSIPTFISQLRNCGIFSDVSYSGYAGNAAATQIATSTDRTSSSSSSSSSSSASGTANMQQPRYSFSVECVLKAPLTIAEQEAAAAAAAEQAAAEAAAAEAAAAEQAAAEGAAAEEGAPAPTDGEG